MEQFDDANDRRYRYCMVLKLKTFQIGDKPKRGDGVRLGVVRYLSRGVKKESY